MSLTEREKEIALKTYRYYVSDWYDEKDEPRILEAFEIFISRIREEQEAVYQMYDGDDCWYDVPKSMYDDSDAIKRIVFTIPPAAPMSNEELLDRYQSLQEDFANINKSCSELVEVLKTALNYIHWVGANYTEKGLPHPQQLLIDKAEQALANHAKRMKGVIQLNVHTNTFWRIAELILQMTSAKHIFMEQMPMKNRLLLSVHSVSG